MGNYTHQSSSVDNDTYKDGQRTTDYPISSPGAFGELNINCFAFLPYKSLRYLNWPCCKIGSQPKVIIWINQVEPVPKAAYQVPEIKNFKSFLPYMGMTAILVDPMNKLWFTNPNEALYAIWFQSDQRFKQRL